MYAGRTVASRGAWVSGAILALLLGAAAAPAEETEAPRYRRDILPILSDRCFACHGPDSASREAGLRLDQAEAATAELDSGSHAIVPGDSAASALFERIESTDPAMAMPPVDSGKTLSDTEKALLRRWVEAGAEYEPHWAYVAPQRPAVPDVAHRDLVRNPIDAFVFARLEAEDAEPSKPASKARLIRRLYFDLIGLPPTLAEIDAFIADESPEAFDRVVERLMKSPHYGERMAADWLDGARFADSNGYQNDFARNMSPWRDWVIQAFNSNMPYDQFVIEQLAGDLLPNPTLQQRIATGFNRNHRTVTEAGSIEEEWHVENVVDRVETTGTVFLGLTVGCARCHDHKFDPISQREFYELFAFFNNINEKGVYTETRGNVPPLVKVVTEDDEKRLAEFAAEIAALTKQADEQMSQHAAKRQQWVTSLAASEGAEPAPVASIDLRNEATAARISIASVDVAADEASPAPEWADELFGKVPAFKGGQQVAYSKLDFPPSDRAFSWAAWVKPEGDGAMLSKMDSGAAFRGVDLLLLADGKVAMHVIHEWPTNAIKVVTKELLPKSKWSHVVATYDGSKKAAGVALYVNGKKQDIVAEVDQLTDTFATEQPLRVGMRSTDAPLHGNVVDVRLYDHALADRDAAKVFDGSLHRAFKDVGVDQLNDGLRGQFDEFLFAYSQDPAIVRVAELRNRLKETKAAKDKYEAELPTTMVLEELAEPRDTFVLQRGRYDLPDKEQKVGSDVPDVLPPMADGLPRNRLGLARWLTSRENPLTARVIVNRLWQRYFGLGLVKTPDNLGVQSEAPSHPQLLDWLAVELMESGWDLQHIQRLIVSSYTYQQQSEAPPEHYERDPENRLLARGPRHRLPAEAVRDNALAVSGLLVPKIGGPSVMPYQPEGLWEELAGGAFEIYTQGHGDDLYRRSLYVYRKRTVPHPSMSTFDAPSWEICQIKRATTNTPLQALALLNDVVYVEAARKFAERMMTEGGTSADARLTFAFRLATGRPPNTVELASLRASLEKYLARFRQSPAAAEELLSHGESPRNKSLDAVELASHTAVASVLLNLDETVSKN